MVRNIAIVVLVLLLLWLLRQRMKATGKLSGSGACTDNIIITFGSNGPEVVKLQKKLNSFIRLAESRNVGLYANLTPTGPMRAVGVLTEDGIYGRDTAAAMQAIFGYTQLYSCDIDSLYFNPPVGTVILDTVITRN